MDPGDKSPVIVDQIEALGAAVVPAVDMVEAAIAAALAAEAMVVRASATRTLATAVMAMPTAASFAQASTASDMQQRRAAYATNFAVTTSDVVHTIQAAANFGTDFTGYRKASRTEFK